MPPKIKKLAVCAAVAAYIGGLSIYNVNPTTTAATYDTYDLQDTALTSHTAPFLATSDFKQPSIKVAISPKESVKVAGTSSVAQAAMDLVPWLNKLATYESGNRPKLVHLDTNGKYSYGCLQFQKATFDAYSRKYGVSGDIFDCDFQKQLATLMIQDSYLNWKHWLNTSHVIGLPPQL